MNKIEERIHVGITVMFLWVFLHSLASEDSWFVFLSYMAVTGAFCAFIWLLRLGYVFGVQLKNRYNQANSP